MSPKSGDYLNGECCCHISPPCHFCVNVVWVVVGDDDLMLDNDGNYTADFDKAAKFASKAEAKEMDKGYPEPRQS